MEKLVIKIHSFHNTERLNSVADLEQAEPAPPPPTFWR